MTTLAAGTQLGPYEITAPIGSGGMGAVYRARDSRLGRDVAVKVLPPAAASDPERLRRFQQEASTTGHLNHPNLLAVYDVGTHDGTPYLVSELLEGQTLRDRLTGGPLPTRKTLDLAQQIAQGLAAAHEKGVVHRDLKPENLFITRDGRVKILDFGLAKLTSQLVAETHDRHAPTVTVGTSDTAPGVVLGTVGYMAPEQVRAQPVDHRADLFAFGTILFEMLSGQRAFRRDSAIETMNAILKDDPPLLSEIAPTAPPALERILHRCLEKSPDERFQSARDLGFALEAVSSETSGSGRQVRVAGPRRRLARWPIAVLGAAVAAALLGAGFWLGRHTGQTAPPRYLRQTFRPGVIVRARFAPAGREMIYSAAWEGGPIRTYITRQDSPESRPFDFPNAGVLAVSKNGDMAIALGQRLVKPFIFSGTLATLSLGGGAPRERLENVQWADWAPDGKQLAVVRELGGKARVEFPIGTVLFETPGWVTDLKFAPDGQAIAFIDHPTVADESGTLRLVDLKGRARELYRTSGYLHGLAWTAAGEVWFTASDFVGGCALRALSLDGSERLVSRLPGYARLVDISSDGRVLLTTESRRSGILGKLPGSGDEARLRDLSWLDVSLVFDLTDDGKTLLMNERGEAAGADSLVYLRKSDGSPAVRLTEGQGTGLSRDGKWVVVIHQVSPQHLGLVPTGAGEAKELAPGPVVAFQYARIGRDGQHVYFVGNEAGQAARLYRQPIAAGAPKAISPPGVGVGFALSEDGRSVAFTQPDRTLAILPTIEEGPTRPVAGSTAGDIPLRWSADGTQLFVYRLGEYPARLTRLDLATGKPELVQELMPADPAGVVALGPVQVTPDGQWFAFTYHRVLSELYLVEGLQ